MPPKKQCKKRGGGFLDNLKKKSIAKKKIEAMKEEIRKKKGYDKTKEARDARKKLTKEELEKQLKEEVVRNRKKINNEVDELLEEMDNEVALDKVMQFPNTPQKPVKKGGSKKKKTKTKQKTKKRKTQKSIFSIFS